eukprot:3214911-Pyramimonas_sp.AAC.1
MSPENGRRPRDLVSFSNPPSPSVERELVRPLGKVGGRERGVSDQPAISFGPKGAGIPVRPGAWKPALSRGHPARSGVTGSEDCEPIAAWRGSRGDR